MPKLSIITVNYNNHEGLKKTVQSVFAQTFTDYEYLIIDGGSDDGSKAFIENSADKLVFWVSEKDTGVYDAMNKGIAKAKGEYLLFLNSGDFLLDDNVLQNVFTENPSKDIIYCDLYWEIDGNKVHQPYPDALSFEHFVEKELPHQASFIKKELFTIVGFYDTQYKIIADWKFFILAIIKHNCSYQHISLPVSVCDRKGISCDPLNADEIKKGRNKIMKENFPVFLNDYYNLSKARKELEQSQNLLSQIRMNVGYRLLSRIKRMIKGKNDSK